MIQRRLCYNPATFDIMIPKDPTLTLEYWFWWRSWKLLVAPATYGLLKWRLSEKVANSYSVHKMVPSLSLLNYRTVLHFFYSLYIVCWHTSINYQLSSASQLSLAQLEERKTVTVQRVIVILRPAVRSREGRLSFAISTSVHRIGFVVADGK